MKADQTRLEAVAAAISDVVWIHETFDPAKLAQAAIEANDGWLAERIDALAIAINKTVGGVCMDYGNNLLNSYEKQLERGRSIVRHILALMRTEPRPSPEDD